MIPSESLIKGSMGVSHTTVGIPLFPISSRTSIRLFVLHTFGSMMLQSSSSSVAILQTMAANTFISFGVVYVVIVGIYLGDCLTTGIVCSIGAKADAKRVGVINILYNLSKSLIVLVAVNLLHAFGVIDKLWETGMTAGTIANTNTIFNLGCAILLLPLVGVYEKLSKRIVKDKEENTVVIPEFNALNPVFYATPALAFNSCYNALKLMFNKSVTNIDRALGLLDKYDRNVKLAIDSDEDIIDELADGVSNYLVQLSPHISEELHIRIAEEDLKAESAGKEAPAGSVVKDEII